MVLITRDQLKKFRLKGPRAGLFTRPSSSCSCWCNSHVRKEVGTPSTVSPRAVCQVSGVIRKAAVGSGITEGQFILERRLFLFRCGYGFLFPRVSLLWILHWAWKGWVYTQEAENVRIFFNWDERGCPSVPLNSPRVYSRSMDLEIWVWEPWAQSVHPMVNRQKQPCDRCEGRGIWRDLTASCFQNRDKVVLLAFKMSENNLPSESISVLCK